MDTNTCLYCKSCGTLLSPLADTCTKCGDPSPFCIEFEYLKKKGRSDAFLLNVLKFFVALLSLGVGLWLYNSTRIVWLSFLVGIVLFFVLRILYDWLEGKVRTRFMKEYEATLRNNLYNKYKAKGLFVLSDEQFSLWKDRSLEIYRKAFNDLLIDFL